MIEAPLYAWLHFVMSFTFTCAECSRSNGRRRARLRLAPHSHHLRACQYANVYSRRPTHPPPHTADLRFVRDSLLTIITSELLNMPIFILNGPQTPRTQPI